MALSTETWNLKSKHLFDPKAFNLSSFELNKYWKDDSYILD